VPQGGVASAWLARLVAPWLQGGEGSGAVSEVAWAPVFLRPGGAFALPQPEPSTPLVMLAAGCAAGAPFRALLQQRRAAGAVGAGAGGEAWLYAACRGGAEGLAYAADFEAAAASGALARFRIAAAPIGDAPGGGGGGGSRHGGGPLQQVVRADTREFAGLVVARGARVRVCADSTAAARAAHAALGAALAAAVGLSEAEAGAELATMAARGQYVKEVWRQ
jgi:sulfite reductase alpha subunit-like flavoprotein